MGIFNPTNKEVGDIVPPKTGVYKFKVTKSELKEFNGGPQKIMFSMSLKDEHGNSGPDLTDFLNINSDKDKAIEEIKRRLKVMIGRVDLESEQEIVGAEGYVVAFKDGRFLRAIPFGGYYDKNKKSVGGNDTILESLTEAVDLEEEALRNVGKKNIRTGAESTSDIDFKKMPT